MSWVAVNSIRGQTVLPLSLEAPQATSQKADITPSKYRVNILKAAEDLVRGRGKRRRVKNTSKHVSTQTKPIDNTICPYDLSLLHESSPEDCHSHQQIHSRGTQSIIQSPKRDNTPFKHYTNYERPSRENCSLSYDHTERYSDEDSMSMTSIDDLSTNCAYDPGDVNFGVNIDTDPSLRAPDASDSPRTRHPSTRDMEEVDSGGSDFEDLDDSIFDEALASLPCSEVSVVTENLRQPTLLPQFPNSSPFPPFVHPCLLESLDHCKSLVKEIDSRAPSVECTCFRIADVLRLSKHLRNIPDGKLREIKLEVFATVSEVRYANANGVGQGIVFGDVFFPRKPPYLTTMSRSPYSAKALIPGSQNDDGSRRVVKATVLLSIRSAATLPEPNAHARYKTSSTSPVNSTENNVVMDFEVLNIHTSSWDEVYDVKMMIEKDHRARIDGQPSKHTIDKYFSKLPQPSSVCDRRIPALESNGIIVTQEEVTSLEFEDLSWFEDDFSDTDLSLPNVEHLFRNNE